ncbi:MAG TPA: hypothetical protein VGP33_04250 [Chloroflexota bacterium]|nr:hypothetical protein [Chloroflexota bacterium]
MSVRRRPPHQKFAPLASAGSADSSLVARRSSRSGSQRRRAALLIATLALLYLVGAWHSGAARWDGLAPTAYRYVKPPSGYTNPGPPAGAKQTVVFSNGVSQSTQVYTADLQAQLTVPDGAFPPRAGGGSVVVTITPQAPPAIGGLVIDGNAYVVQATYADGTPVPAPWPKPLLVYLLFPAQNVPHGLYALHGNQATILSTTVDFPTQSVQGQIGAASTLVAAGPPQAGTTVGASGGKGTTVAIAAAGVGVALVAVGLLLVARHRTGGAHDGGDAGEGDDQSDSEATE